MKFAEATNFHWKSVDPGFPAAQHGETPGNPVTYENYPNETTILRWSNVPCDILVRGQAVPLSYAAQCRFDSREGLRMFTVGAMSSRSFRVANDCFLPPVLLLGAVIALAGAPLRAQTTPTEYQFRERTSSGGETLKYVVYVPQNLRAGPQVPAGRLSARPLRRVHRRTNGF